jgi:hypothetical protein
VVPKAVPKVVPCRPQHQRLLGFMRETTGYWCPGEDVVLPQLLLLCRGLASAQNSEVVPQTVPVITDIQKFQNLYGINHGL